MKKHAGGPPPGFTCVISCVCAFSLCFLRHRHTCSRARALLINCACQIDNELRGKGHLRGSSRSFNSFTSHPDASTLIFIFIPPLGLRIFRGKSFFQKLRTFIVSSSSTSRFAAIISVNRHPRTVPKTVTTNHNLGERGERKSNFW